MSAHFVTIRNWWTKARPKNDACLVTDYVLQDFGENEVSYLSKEAFDTLATGEEEANPSVNLSAWYVVKLE